MLNNRKKRQPILLDQQLCFDSVSWLKQIFHECNQQNIALRAENARLESLLRRSKNAGEDEDLMEVATQLLGELQPSGIEGHVQRRISINHLNQESGIAASAQGQPKQKVPAMCRLPVICPILSVIDWIRLPSRQVRPHAQHSPQKLQYCIANTRRLYHLNDQGNIRHDQVNHPYVLFWCVLVPAMR